MFSIPDRKQATVSDRSSIILRVSAPNSQLVILHNQSTFLSLADEDRRYILDKRHWNCNCATLRWLQAHLSHCMACMSRPHMWTDPWWSNWIGKQLSWAFCLLGGYWTVTRKVENRICTVIGYTYDLDISHIFHAKRDCRSPEHIVRPTELMSICILFKSGNERQSCSVIDLLPHINQHYRLLNRVTKINKSPIGQSHAREFPQSLLPLLQQMLTLQWLEAS